MWIEPFFHRRVGKELKNITPTHIPEFRHTVTWLQKRLGNVLYLSSVKEKKKKIEFCESLLNIFPEVLKFFYSFNFSNKLLYSLWKEILMLPGRRGKLGKNQGLLPVQLKLWGIYSAGHKTNYIFYFEMVTM